jgi:GT2 family glycosyltransferase
VIVIDNNKINKGFAKAANLGVQKARGEYLLFLNPDTAILEGDFKKLLSNIKQQTDLGVVGLKMVLKDGSPQPYSFGKKLSLRNAIFHRRDAINRVSTRIDWVSGGAMVMRKSLFDKLGGFDEQFFMYFEDQDLCLRAKDLGFKVELWQDIKILHHGGKPLGGKSHQSRRNQLKIYYGSQSKFIKKYYGPIYTLLFRCLRFPLKVSRKFRV